MEGRVFNLRIIFKGRIDTNLYRFRVTSEYIRGTISEPYNSGKTFMLDGRIIAPIDILQINIRSVSPRPSHNSPIRRKLDQFLNPDDPNSFEFEGQDVTEEFLFGPPGSGQPVPDSPGLPSVPLSELFDSLVTDSLIRQSSRRLFLDKHYSNSVERAFVCINNAVKGKSEQTGLDGASLMRKAFSAQEPILKFNEGRTTSERDEQEGYMHLYEGAMLGVRNPRVHENQLEDDPTTALSLLALANHLMNKLDDSKKK